MTLDPDGLVIVVIISFALGYIYRVAIEKMRVSDPVYNCDLYKDQGCAHVDGPLCDFPKCSMLNDYRESK